MSEHEYVRPFPALTPRQRLHLDVYGYVVIEKAISDDLTTRLRDKTYEIEETLRTTGKLPPKVTTLFADSREYFRVDNLPHVDPCYLEYVAHPYLVGMAEEATGFVVRLEQSDVHIRRAPADKSQQGYGFHRGADTSLCYREKGLFHCHFVKTLTNLTDLGPDDGGTTVIAGSHKLTDVPADVLIRAAEDDPSLIHQVIAPAGSTLLFFEALMHSSGIIRSDKDRMLIIGGYTPTMFVPWQGYDPLPKFVDEVSPSLKPLITGSSRYHRTPRYRGLEQPAQPASAAAAHEAVRL